MKLEDALKRREEMTKKRMEIRKIKGHDYALEEDCLVNFKNVAAIMKILKVDITTPEGVAIFYIVLKLDRTCNLLFRRQGKPQAESLEDTVAIDGPNYWDLLDEILAERGYYQKNGQGSTS